MEIKPALLESDRPEVKLDDGTRIKSRLIIGSDGEKSKTREEYGISAWGSSYSQDGIVCTVSTT